MGDHVGSPDDRLLAAVAAGLGASRQGRRGPVLRLDDRALVLPGAVGREGSVRALRRRVRRDDSDCSLGFLLGCQLARPVPGRNSTAFEMGASP